MTVEEPADVTHPVSPPRSSVTETAPRVPVMVLVPLLIHAEVIRSPGA